MLIAIVSSDFDSNSHLEPEVKSLERAIKKVGIDVQFLAPKSLWFQFNRENKDSTIHMEDGIEMRKPDALIVRRTRGSGGPIELLVQVLANEGCIVSDPLERFTGGNAPSKHLSTYKRHLASVGTTSCIAYNSKTALSAAKIMLEQGKFPIILKPLAGTHGEGIELSPTLEKAKEIIAKAFDKKDDAFGLIIQPWINLESEWRVVVLDGVVLGSARKVAATGHIAANAAQGGHFIVDDREDVKDFALKNCKKEGLVGADVALDKDGNFHLLEENYSPQWLAFESATGVDVAEALVNRIIQRLKS